MEDRDSDSARRGLLYGLAAYGLWGLIPLYFRALSGVSALEILAQRIVWSFAVLSLAIALLGRWVEVRRVLLNFKTLGLLCCSATLIGLNWLTYIHAVSTGQVLQASLGYFVTPLLNVLTGVVLLKEHLRPVQIAAMGIAVAGVFVLAMIGGEMPWIAVALAISFALYGLLRKQMDADGMIGLFVETLLLLPICLSYVVYLQVSGGSALFAGNPRLDFLLIASGAVTTAPLVLFASAARNLPMATLGILQYLAPSVQFALAVLAFGEPFSQAKFASFCFIWAAVALYVVDSWRARTSRLEQAGNVQASQAISATVGAEEPESLTAQ